MALLTRDAFPDALALIEQKFDVSEIDNDRMWLFTLHHQSDDHEYDYLVAHLVEIGRLLTAAVSKKPPSFAAHDISEIIRRVKQLSPNATPNGWAELFDRY